MLTVWSGIKSKWALAGEKGLVDIKWYDKKWFITTRKILFPIDLAVHIAIGAVTAPFKFIKSFFMGFRTAARITKDIYSNKPNEHCYSNGDWCLPNLTFLLKKSKTYNNALLKPVFIINNKKSLKMYEESGYINSSAKKIVAIKNYIDEQVPLKTSHIWESSIPKVTIVNKTSTEEDKSILKHIQSIAGLRSIKPTNEYNKYIDNNGFDVIKEIKVHVLEPSER